MEACEMRRAWELALLLLALLQPQQNPHLRAPAPGFLEKSVGKIRRQMPSPNKKPPTNVTPVPGTIVWVRRRNGSWWPGRIISKKELLASNVMSPRSGTPVKLLGREDASVDWYNIEKSKRVKPFRCGEFDDCIEKAQAIVGMQSKRREKYARREDAIVDALELEKEQDEQLRSFSGNASAAGKKSKVKGKQKNADVKEDPTYEQPPVRKYSRKTKAKVVKDRNISELEDGTAMLPRMRGLQDLVSGGASSKFLEGSFTLEGCSEASLLDDPPDAPQGKAMKRKRSVGRPSAEDIPAKRREKRRAIVQVMETLQRDADEPDTTMDDNQTEEKTEAEDKLSDECESTQERLNQLPNGSSRNAAHALDAQSTSYSSKQTDSQPLAGDGALQQSTLTSASVPSGRRAPGPKATKAQKKGKLKNAIDTGKTKSKVEASEQQEQKPKAEANGNGKALSSKLEPEETVTGCCPSTKSDGQKAPLAAANDGGTAQPHPKTRFEKQPVPMISIRSALNKKPVYGYPVAVEVVRETRRRRAVARNQYGDEYEDSGGLQPIWQTAKRTARQRTPRSGIQTYEDAKCQPGGTQRRPAAGKEALSKKLLKKAVMTSKKIRTLASISEEKRGTFKQPQMVRMDAVPRWPVATLVPVSVALNRLRAAVCS